MSAGSAEMVSVREAVLSQPAAASGLRTVLPLDAADSGRDDPYGDWRIRYAGRGDGPLGDASALGPSLQLFREN